MSIRIVVTVRTRNEAHRIGQFCEAYKDANLILVGDGGSVDNTVEIAKQYKNVLIRQFQGRTKMKERHWRNNDSYHANWMFEWAKEMGADWIIYDDCDCRPNYLLKQDYREILEETPCDFVMVTRFYLWGLDQHFPHMAKPDAKKDHKVHEPSLWAWRGHMDFWTIDIPPAYNFRIGEQEVKDLHFDANTLDLFPPYALLHFSWDNEERVNQKIGIYRESGLIPNMNHPLEFAGPLEPLPKFLHE
jgi:glycosyltransferase involved in cell wall biosynthesis